jgi:hypothetical protein
VLEAFANFRKHRDDFKKALLVSHGALAVSVLGERYADRWLTIGEVDGR